MQPPLARASPDRRSGRGIALASLVLTVAWTLTGALTCAAAYAMSLQPPENPADASPFPASLWFPVLVLWGLLAVALTPSPAVLLVSGLIYLRRVALTGWRWRSGWAGAAVLAIAIEALFLHGVVDTPALRRPSLGPPMLSAGFVAIGVAMIATLAIALRAADFPDSTAPLV
jgi:hypothetical protein